MARVEHQRQSYSRHLQTLPRQSGNQVYVLFHTEQSGTFRVYSRPRIVNLSNEEIGIFYAVTTTTNYVATSVAGDSNTVGLSEDSQ